MYDEEIEKAMLYYLIFEDEQFDLTEEDFINTTHKNIIKAIQELKLRKEKISILAIHERIKDESEGTLEYIADLGNYLSYKNTAKQIYEKLKEYTKKRQLLNIAKTMQKDITVADNVDIYIEKLIKNLEKIEFQTEKENNFVQQVIKTVEEIEKNVKRKDDYSLHTGYFDLDRLTDGLHNGEFTVIGARPGVGKTTFSLQIADNIASKGKKVMYVSLEMSEEQIIQKIMSRLTRINSRQIRNGDLNDEQLNKLLDICGKISELPISIITKINTIQQIEIEARRMKNRNNLDLLIIDYMQLLKNDGSFKSREQEVADISRTLKLLSLELDIPIIALCQLNRNASKNEPTLADIRESGAIEQDADNVIFLYQENSDDNIVIVDLQKQRTGNIGTLKLKFRKQNSEFVNIER